MTDGRALPRTMQTPFGDPLLDISMPEGNDLLSGLVHNMLTQEQLLKNEKGVRDGGQVRCCVLPRH